VAGNQRGDGVPIVLPPWPGCLSVRACMCTDEAPSTPASYTYDTQSTKIAAYVCLASLTAVVCRMAGFVVSTHVHVPYDPRALL
jgi:hypothetical protein